MTSRQACDTRFMRPFLQSLANSGQARRFMLEITEEAFLSSSQFQRRVLPLIREVGAHVSMTISAPAIPRWRRSPTSPPTR